MASDLTRRDLARLTGAAALGAGLGPSAAPSSAPKESAKPPAPMPWSDAGASKPPFSLPFSCLICPSTHQAASALWGADALLASTRAAPA